MSGIFISHSTKDKALVEAMVELFQTGMGIGRERIFCTSLNGTLPTGKDFITEIKSKMEEYNIVVAVITPAYLKSLFCMMELGAAWMSAEMLYPILADGVEYTELDKTPLKSVQMRVCKNEEDWFAIYDEFLRWKIIQTPDTLRAKIKIPEFLEKIKIEENPIIKADAEGYYEVYIEARRYVPEPYRCYRIKGNLDLPEKEMHEKETHEKESHWVFFKAGAYDDLKEGDIVRLKINSTVLKKFSDIGYARNIYPDELEVL